MPNARATWLLLIGLSEAHSRRANSTFCCLLINPTVRGIFLRYHSARSGRRSASSGHQAIPLVHSLVLCCDWLDRADREKCPALSAARLDATGSPSRRRPSPSGTPLRGSCPSASFPTLL